MSTPQLERKVRSRDPETSWNAAAIDPASWSALQTEIMTILTDRGPLTDEQIHSEYLARGNARRSQSRIRTARKELELSGHVKPAGVGVSRMGNGSQTWEVRS